MWRIQGQELWLLSQLNLCSCQFDDQPQHHCQWLGQPLLLVSGKPLGWDGQKYRWVVFIKCCWQSHLIFCGSKVICQVNFCKSLILLLVDTVDSLLLLLKIVTLVLVEWGRRSSCWDKFHLNCQLPLLFLSSAWPANGGRLWGFKNIRQRCIFGGYCSRRSHKSFS